MKIIDVQSKDIYVTFEMSLRQIDLILEFLDHCEVKYNSEKEPKMVEADEYIKTVFVNLTELYNNLTSKVVDKNSV